MFSFLNFPAKLIRLLEANVSPGEVAAGVCLGMFMGFVPLNGPMAVFLAVFFLVFKLNRISTLVTLPFFKFFYFLGLWRVTDIIGGYLLVDAEYLNYFWRVVTGLPILAYADLNNTLVAGGLVLSAVLCVPVYLLARKGAGVLQAKYAEKMKDTKFMKTVKKFMPFLFLDTLADKVKGKI